MRKTLTAISVIMSVCLIFTSCGNKTSNSAEKNITGIKDERINEIPDTKILKGADTGTADTYTGYEKLECVNFNVTDAENTRNYSNKKISHSFGKAKDGVPHEISLTSQKYFEDNNFDAVTLDTKTDEKVLYLTFDCGYENGYTSKILQTLKEKKVPAAFFCTLHEVKSNPELAAKMITDGHILGNHTATHPSMDEISRTEMAKEIKQMDDWLREHFGYSAKYFRFPKGEYSANALENVTSLGYTSVFWSIAYEDWNLDNQKGTEFALQSVKSQLHPGAVILLHSVSPDNAAALGDIIDTARDMGYTFKSLTDLP